MEFAGLPSGFEREEGAKPVLALHYSVTAFSVKKRLMDSLTFGGERGRRDLVSSQAVMQGAHSFAKNQAGARYAIAPAQRVKE